MKRLILITAVLSIAAASLALERKFGKEYEYSPQSINTSDSEKGISYYKSNLTFSRNDSSYVVLPTAKKKENKVLSGLHYDGQFAYNSKSRTIYFSKDGSLFEYSENTKETKPLEIEGISISRTKFEGSSMVYRRWRFKRETVFGLYNPALDAKGGKLYFSAELKNGKGGRDIWMITKKTDGTWSAPQQVADINSENNEDYPFLTGDSLLYFSSDRPDELAGWNIFKSRLKGAQNVERLDEGVNSNSNDYNFIGDSKMVYVISDRNGNPDIYSPQIKIVQTTDTATIDTTPMKTAPVDSVSKDSLPPAVRYNWEFEPCTFYFEFDKDVLVKEYDKQIKDYAHFMKSNPDKKFVIYGYCDARGGDDYNFKLSERRCRTLYTRLLAEGVDPKQLENRGLGKTDLAEVNAATEEQHLLNRRVIIKVDK